MPCTVGPCHDARHSGSPGDLLQHVLMKLGSEAWAEVRGLSPDTTLCYQCDIGIASCKGGCGLNSPPSSCLLLHSACILVAGGWWLHLLFPVQFLRQCVLQKSSEKSAMFLLTHPFVSKPGEIGPLNTLEFLLCGTFSQYRASCFCTCRSLSGYVISWLITQWQALTSLFPSF